MKKQMIKNSYGQEIELRYMEDYVPGDMDPRVYAINRQEREKAEKEGAGNAGKEPQTPEETLAVIRAHMGWENQDVTAGQVLREEMEVEMGDHTVSVLGYHLPEKKVRPCIIFIHGGGFFGGTTKCVENPCKALAMYADAVVLSVDYRLAPEHPFPAGFDDCYGVVQWAFDHSEELGIDKSHIGIAGDSAGGNLSAVCTLKDHCEGRGILSFQALIYPTVNMAALPNDEYSWNIGEYDVRQHFPYVYPAVIALGNEPEGVGRMYLGEDYVRAAANPYVSPLLAREVSDLPPTVIVNAEYDYLRLEGEAYGRKLAKAGVPVRMVRYCGMDHAFMDKIGEYPQAEDMMKLIAEEFVAQINAGM